jgi:tryptophanyl-tRNA synthetase
MAADILIHRANYVPVGKDQEQHLEMTRTYARRFNHIYESDFFPEPLAYNFGEQLIKVPGLDGSGKMSKSDNPNSAIFMDDEDAVIRKKIMRAKTDSGPSEAGSEKSPEIANLFMLMEIVSEPSTVAEYEAAFQNASIRYGDLKKQLAEDMVAYIRPFRERIDALMADEAGLNSILKHGAESARESAAETVRRARELIGIKYYA